MKKTATDLKDCYILEPTRFGDARGYFSAPYIDAEYRELGFQGLMQVSRSKSAKGVLRGMHFQKDDYVQAKVVEAVQGAVVDVVVDLRKDSPSYGKWTSVLLTPENGWQLYVPRGFAHGFISLEDDTVFQYFVDNAYAPEHEGGIAWDDPTVGIDWQSIFNEYGIEYPELSEKDSNRMSFAEFDKEQA